MNTLGIFTLWGPTADWIISIAAVLSALALIYKFVLIPTRRWFHKLDSGVNSILGYPAVTDPGTGLVIQPTTEPMAVRVKRLEDAALQTAEALTKIADNHGSLIRLETGLSELTARFETHERETYQWMQRHTEFSEQWTTQHEQEHRGS